VIHLLLLAVEHDLAHSAVALIELSISYELAVGTTWTVDTKTV
jgi:hypothetical protein